MLNVAALTIWKEARGEGSDGMLAVGWVIRNRAAHGHPWPTDADRVCLQRRQFSCWNDADPQRDLWPQPGDASYIDAESRWSSVGQGDDPTGGATYYVNASVLNHNPFDNPAFIETVKIGAHTFYRDAT